MAVTVEGAAAGLAMKGARAAVRSDLVAGRVSLADALELPAVADIALADVVRMQWRGAGRRAVPALERLGCRAVGDGVNLLAPAGHASIVSRAWVAEHGSKWARKAVAS